MEQLQLGEQDSQKSLLKAVPKALNNYQQVDQPIHTSLRTSELASKVQPFLKISHLSQFQERNSSECSAQATSKNIGIKGRVKNAMNVSKITVNQRKSLTPFQNRKLQQKSIHTLKTKKRDYQKKQQMKQFKSPFILIESIKSNKKDKLQLNSKTEKVFQDNLMRIKSRLQSMQKSRRLNQEQKEQQCLSKIRSDTKVQDMMVLSTFQKKQRRSSQQFIRHTTQSSFSLAAQPIYKPTFKRKNSATLNHTIKGRRLSKTSEKIMVKEQRRAHDKLRPYLFSRQIGSMIKIKSLSKSNINHIAASEQSYEKNQHRRYVERLKKGRCLSEKKNRVKGYLQSSNRDLLKLQFKMLELDGWEQNHQSLQKVLFS